jgi:phosphoribosyl-AMP cyclohydrolase
MKSKLIFTEKRVDPGDCRIETGEILMVAYMNMKANKTRERKAVSVPFPKRAWLRGTSQSKSSRSLLDCDNDALLLKVEQIGGAACHTGYRSCFYRRVADGRLETVGERVFDPQEVYGG